MRTLQAVSSLLLVLSSCETTTDCNLDVCIPQVTIDLGAPVEGRFRVDIAGPGLAESAECPRDFGTTPTGRVTCTGTSVVVTAPAAGLRVGDAIRVTVAPVGGKAEERTVAVKTREEKEKRECVADGCPAYTAR